MSIEFGRKDGELILILAPERIYASKILDVLNTKGKWMISHSFTVTKQNFRSEDTEQNELRFCIGTVYDEYTLVDNSVIGTTHNFYFSNTINLKNSTLLHIEIYQFFLRLTKWLITMSILVEIIRWGAFHLKHSNY